MPRGKEIKCLRCLREKDCNLRHLMELTMPWVKEALIRVNGSDWDRQNAVCRALRGNGASPGFTEDWINESALTPDEFKAMVGDIVESGRVDYALLSKYCRRCIEIKNH